MALSLSRTASNGFVPDFPSSWSKEVGLIVHVVEARGLINKDLFGGKSNPFVVLKLWGQERVSHVIKNCLSPKWNQTFMFSLYNENVVDDELIVTLWDKDSLFKNGFLGMVKIAMGPLIDNEIRDLWYPLEKRSAKSRVKGNIRLWTQLTISPKNKGPSPSPSPSPFLSLPSSLSMPSISSSTMSLDGASTGASLSSSTSSSTPSNAFPKAKSSLGISTASVTPSVIPKAHTILVTPSSNHVSLFHSNDKYPPKNGPSPITPLDESDFLYIEKDPVREDKGKGKSKEKDSNNSNTNNNNKMIPNMPSSPLAFAPFPPSSYFDTYQPPPAYYDAYGDPVEDAEMVAILRMEDEEKRMREAEEEKLLREYLSTLHRCSVCGAEDGGEGPLVLQCDHTFCRNCLASHIRLTLKNSKQQQGLAGLTCPTCNLAVAEWAVKRALPSHEYEGLLHQDLQGFIDSGNSGIFRCPTATCGAPIEKIPYKHKEAHSHHQHHHSNEEIVEQHREEFRFRCRSCSTEFCSGCMTIPYHAGYTCEGYSRYLKAKHCRFCAVTLDSGGNASASNDVCKSEECMEKAKLCCKKWNPCGHACGGILDESQCLPCLQCQNAGTSEQCADDYCNICWVESLGSAPAVKLKCGHVFHHACVKSKLRKRWPAARITFGFSECPLCKVTIDHPAFEEELKPMLELRTMVQQKAMQRLEFEGLSKAKELTDPSSKFYNHRERYAMDRYAYFMCFKCNLPYFAGQRRCDAGEEDKPFDPADLVCGACCGSSQTECAVHGKDFLEWKCQFCCTISSWYCWGKTHFCNDCHTRQQKGDYLTKKPKSAIPMCPGIEKCPLGVAHPHCEEYLLGCALCRNVRSF